MKGGPGKNSLNKTSLIRVKLAFESEFIALKLIFQNNLRFFINFFKQMFLIIITRCFFSFYNIFFLYSTSFCFSCSGRFLNCSQPAFSIFFSFLSLERLLYLSRAFFEAFLYYFDNISS